MHKKYKSKNGFFIIVMLILIVVFILNETYFYDGTMFGVIFFPIIILFFSTFLFRTYYIITDDKKLNIVCGYLYSKTIEIVDIVRISDAKGDGANAPALSMDRIEIKYGIDKTVLLSPKNKKDFIENLLKINPNIELKGF